MRPVWCHGKEGMRELAPVEQDVPFARGTLPNQAGPRQAIFPDKLFGGRIVHLPCNIAAGILGVFPYLAAESRARFGGKLALVLHE